MGEERDLRADQTHPDLARVVVRRARVQGDGARKYRPRPDPPRHPVVTGVHDIDLGLVGVVVGAPERAEKDLLLGPARIRDDQQTRPDRMGRQQRRGGGAAARIGRRRRIPRERLYVPGEPVRLLIDDDLLFIIQGDGMGPELVRRNVPAGERAADEVRGQVRAAPVGVRDAAGLQARHVARATHGPGRLRHDLDGGARRLLSGGA